MKKTTPLGIAKYFLLLIWVLSFVVLGNTKTFAQTTTPPAGSVATLRYVKDLLRIRSTYQYPQMVWGATVANNKFIFKGKGCLQNMNNSGTGGGVWIASEDGSTITERDTCLDAGARTKNTGGSFHGMTTSGDIHLNLGGAGFVKENYSHAPIEANHAVYYSEQGIPISSSPLGVYNSKLIVLKNRVLARSANGDRSNFDLISLPDWKLIGTVAIPPEFFSGGTSFFGFGFGDFVVKVEDGSLFSVSETGVMKKVKNLASAEHVYKVGNSINYSFDYSTTPAKLAVFEINRTSVATQQFVNNRKISVYKLSSEGVILDKVINLPDDDAFPHVSNNNFNPFGIWGDYVVVTNGAYQNSDLQLWKGGQKIHTLPTKEQSPDTIMISKNGYVATSTWSSPFGFNEEGQLDGGTAAILYKIEGGSSGSSTSPYPPVSSDSSCAASISFDKTSVPYGGSMTESWTVVGADVGQVYGDCGQGPTGISAGPQSYTFNNLTKTMTCRVYGKIGGQEQCSASATATVGAKPSVGGGDPGPKVDIPESNLQTGDYFNYFQNTSDPYSASGSSSAASKALLKQGSSGPDVVALQTRLNQEMNAGLSTDGKFGPKTNAAVMAYQKANGLVIDGLVGPKTRAALGF